MFKRYPVSLTNSIVILVYLIGLYHCNVDVRELKCLVCTRVVEEIQKNISTVNSEIKINVGGFRLDGKGNYLEKSVPYSKSEIYLTEVMEDVCNKMDDYVRATFKKTGKLTVIPLVTGDGQMNPIMSEVDVVQDSDLNKSLKFYCEELVDEHDEIFVKEFSEEQDDFISSICGESTQLCGSETIQLSRLTADEL